MALFKFNKQANASENTGARSGVKFSEKGISEITSGRIVVFIPREQIQRVELKYGSHAERPMLQLILGVLLVGLGVIGFLMIENGGVLGAYRGLGPLIFGVIGCYCLFEAIRRGHYLAVVCVRDKRKIRLGGTVSQERISKLTHDASEFGYDLRDCLAEKKSALVSSS